MKPQVNVHFWVIAFVIAFGTFFGLFWLGAVVVSHVLGISVKDALIGMLTAY